MVLPSHFFQYGNYFSVFYIHVIYAFERFEKRQNLSLNCCDSSKKLGITISSIYVLIYR